ncbi:MAG: hypothetical protein JO036_21560 [Candidatus Eremiobacteraeota bacterium]|nr:hypothetical protein [Candidatus Eremiobacteraeota bacterium]
MRHVLLFGVLAASLGSQSAAQTSSAAATSAPPQARCEYLPTGPELPHLGSGPPQASYSDATHTVTVILHLVRGADLEKHVPYYLAAPSREPVQMKMTGPIVGPDAVRRFGAAKSDPGEYWTLEGPLPLRTSFAVYFDEVWTGTDTRTDQPCSSAFRHMVTAVAEGPQLENERGPAGLRPLVRLDRPLSTATLSSLRVPAPSALRALDPEQPVRTVVRFRAVSFQPRDAKQATAALDTRRAFDVAVTTSSSAPANLEYRFVIDRADDGAFVVERFAWSVGDPVAGTETLRPHAVTGPDGLQLLRLETGYGTSVALHLRSRATGSLQIIDATR